MNEFVGLLYDKIVGSALAIFNREEGFLLLLLCGVVRNYVYLLNITIYIINEWIV